MTELQETQALGFGRLASRLGLENHLIENGVLFPDRPLIERSKIAHGVVWCPSGRYIQCGPGLRALLLVAGP